MGRRRPGGGRPEVIDVTQFVDEGLGNSSYLVDVGDGRAIVVDPSRDPRPYLTAAQAHGLTITHAVETHLHADFVSGSRELAARGARVIAPAGADLGFAHDALPDDARITVGDGATLRVIATPGHTPEHAAYLLTDDDEVPLALFSGGALIVGAIARTDLISPDETEGLTRDAYRAAQARFAPLPDDLAVYPTHGAGSFCSTGGSDERVTTIGRERATNPVFTEGNEDGFVRQTVASFGSFPLYFLRLRPVNRRGPKVYGDAPPVLQPIGASEIRDDAVLVDARPIERFAGGHIPGSISIELRPAFATWLGWLARDGAPIAFVLDDDQDEAELVRQCLKIGYEDLRGRVDMRSFEGDLSNIPIVAPESLTGSIVDIRQGSELTSFIPGSRHVELAEIANAELPNGPLTLHCNHGERAMTAASLLERSGRDRVSVMSGSPADWSAATGIALRQS